MIVKGRNWMMWNADCLELAASRVLQCHHVITDPPYEVECHTKARRSLKDASQKRGASNKGEVRAISEPIAVNFDAMTPATRLRAAEVFAANATRWVIAFCQVEAVAAWRSALEAAKLQWVRGGIWTKPNATPQFTGDRPGVGFECLAIAHPKGRKRWNGGGLPAVWAYPLDHYAHKGIDHPTIKPLALMLRLVEQFTDPGESIMDPYAGSGTTGVAAIRLGRKFCGIERDPKYFELACDRLSAEERGLTIQDARAGQASLFDKAVAS